MSDKYAELLTVTRRFSAGQTSGQTLPKVGLIHKEIESVNEPAVLPAVTTLVITRVRKTTRRGHFQGAHPEAK